MAEMTKQLQALIEKLTKNDHIPLKMGFFNSESTKKDHAASIKESLKTLTKLDWKYHSESGTAWVGLAKMTIVEAKALHLTLQNTSFADVTLQQEKITKTLTITCKNINHKNLLERVSSLTPNNQETDSAAKTTQKF